MSAAKLLYVFCQLHIIKIQRPGRITLQLIGAATFFSLPKLTEVLDELPVDTELHVDFTRLTYIDHASLDLLMKWEEQYKTQGGSLTIDWGLIQAKFDSTSIEAPQQMVQFPDPLPSQSEISAIEPGGQANLKIPRRTTKFQCGKPQEIQYPQFFGI